MNRLYRLLVGSEFVCFGFYVPLKAEVEQYEWLGNKASCMNDFGKMTELLNDINWVFSDKSRLNMSLSSRALQNRMRLIYDQADDELTRSLAVSLLIHIGVDIRHEAD